MNQLFKYIFYYLVGFTILYIDGSNNEEGMTIGQIWKIPVLLWIAYKVIYKIRFPFIKIRFSYSFIKFLNKDSIVNIAGNLSTVLKSLSLPLFLNYISAYVNYKQAQRFLLIFSHVIIVSFIPFWIGFVDERYSYIGASLLDVSALIGPFNNAHAASIYLSTALLYIVYYTKQYNKTKIERYYHFSLIIIGSYFLIQTYVRTGYLMFVIGVLCLFYSSGKNFIRKIFIFMISCLFLVFIFSILMEKNQTLEARLMEKNEYKNDAIDGNGRIKFWYTSIQLWMESNNLWNLLLGYGEYGVADRQAEKNGMRIFSHNGFINALAANGAIGLILLIAYYILLLKFNKRYKKTCSFRLFIAWFLSDLSFQMVQGGNFFFYDLMSAIIILLPQKENSYCKLI